MTVKLLIGPLLGLESDTLYTVCFSTSRAATRAAVTFNGNSVNALKVGDTYSTSVWRAEWTAAPQIDPRLVRYSIQVDGNLAYNQDGSEWTFYVPGSKEKPRMLYASCNGFSSPDLMTKTERPYILWGKIRKFQQAEMAKVNTDDIPAPYSLMLLGGDQLYADELWTRVPLLNKWSHERHDKKLKTKSSKTLEEQLERFYDELYQSRWNKPDMSLMLASIPNLMMWDDHDIFDGWGSFPSELQECEVFKAIFKVARRYFELLQIRSRHNHALLDRDADHYAFAVPFRGYHILALDNRAERTRKQVMSPRQWHNLIDYLDHKATHGDLLLMSAVPVVYRDFSFTETVFDTTPWEEELTDDLKDHWRAKDHQGERARLIMRLLKNVELREKNNNNHCRTVILSGDVHIGCLGVINERRDGKTRRIHQVVSSGIVHPAPSKIQWYGIMAVTNDDTEYLNEDKSIEIRMLKPHSSEKYLRVRNYVSLLEGSDKKLWLNWVCDSDEKPVYPLD
jgi:hypothetical protein